MSGPCNQQCPKKTACYKAACVWMGGSPVPFESINIPGLNALCDKIGISLDELPDWLMDIKRIERAFSPKKKSSSDETPPEKILPDAPDKPLRSISPTKTLPLSTAPKAVAYSTSMRDATLRCIDVVNEFGDAERKVAGRSGARAFDAENLSPYVDSIKKLKTLPPREPAWLASTGAGMLMLQRLAHGVRNMIAHCTYDDTRNLCYQHFKNLFKDADQFGLRDEVAKWLGKEGDGFASRLLVSPLLCPPHQCRRPLHHNHFPAIWGTPLIRETRRGKGEGQHQSVKVFSRLFSRDSLNSIKTKIVSGDVLRQSTHTHTNTHIICVSTYHNDEAPLQRLMETLRRTRFPIANSNSLLLTPSQTFPKCTTHTPNWIVPPAVLFRALCWRPFPGL